MSDSDSFIDEVSEEVRKDRLYGLLRRYGWIAAVAVLALVGGAAYNEYTKAQARNAAQALGDAMLSALENPDALDRASALRDIETDNPGGAAVLALLTAAQEAESGDTVAATRRLDTIAADLSLPLIYRQVASYKSLLSGAQTLDLATRIAGFEALSTPGNPLRLLAEEQLALIEVEQGNTDAAIAQFERILEDSEATSGLQARAAQMITALGGSLPDV